MAKKLTQVLTVLALLLVPSAAFGASPRHNPRNAYDVDDNTRVTPRDALLIINQLQQQGGSSSVSPFTASETTFFWDTTDDNRITPRDALLVINQLQVANTPEPSTVVSAGIGLVVLAGYCWRRKRKTSHLPG